MRSVLAFGLVLALALAGCLSGSSPSTSPATKATSNVTASATDATAKGASVNAPSKPFQADSVSNANPSEKTSTTIYPFVPHAQRDKPAQRVVIKGTFNATDCTVPVSGIAYPTLGQGAWQTFNIKKYFEAGDTFDLNETLTWTNAAPESADLHLVSFVTTDSYEQSDPTYGTSGPVTLQYDVQQAWPTDASNAYAWVGAACFYATNAQAIDYTLTLTITYLRGIAPAHTPVLLHVSQNVTELIASGVGIVPSARPTAHYRIFDPDDHLLGSFALHSDGSAVRIPVNKSGDYVLLVDHTENGYVAIGANAAPANNEMIFLKTGWVEKALFDQQQPGPAALAGKFILPRVPLALYTYVSADATTGTATVRNLDLKVKGPLGLVEEETVPGLVVLNLRAVCDPCVDLGAPVAGWSWTYDHHALALGEHAVTVNADEFSGAIMVSMQSYYRPGESQLPAPIAAGASSPASDAGALPVNGLL